MIIIAEERSPGRNQLQQPATLSSDGGSLLPFREPFFSPSAGAGRAVCCHAHLIPHADRGAVQRRVPPRERAAIAVVAAADHRCDGDAPPNALAEHEVVALAERRVAQLQVAERVGGGHVDARVVEHEVGLEPLGVTWRIPR